MLRDKALTANDEVWRTSLVKSHKADALAVSRSDLTWSATYYSQLTTGHPRGLPMVGIFVANLSMSNEAGIPCFSFLLILAVPNSSSVTEFVNANSVFYLLLDRG